MRLLLLSTATLALSGCSFLGMGNNGYSHAPSYGTGYSHGTTTGKCGVKTVNQYPGATGCQRPSLWNLEGAAGAEFMVGGDFTTPEDVTAIPGVTLNDVSMSDAFDTGMRYELGVSRLLNPNRKLTLMGSYTQADGNDVQIASDSTDPTTQIRGQVSDYTSYGLEAGLRQYFKPTRAPIVQSIRPYVEGRIGAANVDDIAFTNIDSFVGGVTTSLGGPVEMYEGGWVASGAGRIGVEAPLFKQATLGLETGLRYRGKLASDTTTLSGGSGVEGLNNGSENWSVPVTLRALYRF